MSELNEDNLSQDDLQEQYLKTMDTLKEGQLIQGSVLEVSDEFVFIDVGYKSEGKIPLTEFEEKPKIGDTVKVVLLYKEGRNGQVIVSKRKADEIDFWQQLQKSYREHLPVEAVIVKSVKGGFEAKIQEHALAMVPMSQVDNRKVEDPQEYIGLKSKFYIERIYKSGQRRIVLSRRAWLEDKSRQQQDDFFKLKNIGDEVEGTVKSFTSFGVFINLGGFDGLLHNSDLSWSKTAKAKDLFNKNDKVKLKIINIDRDKKKISLSLKEMTPNPWKSFEERYETGDIVKGKVTKLVEYGAFVELEPGIEGLVHISELSWVRKVRHPKEVFNVNDTVEVKILDFDLHEEKVSLSLKHVLKNPWDDLEERYPEGSRIKRTIKNLSATGAFLELEEGIDGFLHVDDISWTKHVKKSKDALKAGEEIEVMILKIDKENKKVRLGLKQLSDDPWQALQNVFSKGSVIEGEIKSIMEPGIELEVQGGIKGFIKRSQICDPTLEKVEEVITRYKVGDKIKASIIELVPKRKKLGLSLRDYADRERAKDMEKYLHDEEDQIETATLADIIKEKEAK
ncbi:MAG: 30S ribosomal protein S1 [Spirochaetales bacterium]|nr:30S ribosomal protein S1 [Spirochaetales bacterium]